MNPDFARSPGLCWLAPRTKATALLALLAIGSSPIWAQIGANPLATFQDCGSPNRDGESLGFLSSDSVGAGETKPADSPASNGTSAVLVHPTSRKLIRPDFNRNTYYKNKLEFSVQMGWLPNNIPFVFDFLLGGGYSMPPLKYTLVPIIGSLRWQTGDVRGPWILRGNWDLNVSGSFTLIPRGPETRYWGYMMGVRRNFVQPNWRVAPYFEGRVGIGNVDAKQPQGVLYAQGQDLTFNLNLASGMRFNVNPRYGISAGVGYMHISNLYLSEPKYLNYGINVYGPMIGLDLRLGKPKQYTE